jgi:primosomal protein N' (replication factor Y)
VGGHPAGRRPTPGTGPLIVRVLPDVSGLAKRFDYAVPDKWRDEVRVGTRVRVRLHGRPVGGWVVEEGVESPPGVTPLPIAAVSGYGPPAGVIELAEWAAWRWAVPVATLLRTASPVRNVRSLPTAAPVAAADPVVHSSGTELHRLPPATDPLPVVLESIDRAQGRGSVVVLVPSVGWAERMTARLRRRGVPVARDWAEAAAGWPVVVGSRAAAWAPVPRMAAAVVVDAHDEAYRDRYDAGEVLAERAARDGAPCVLLSPCPTAVEVARYRLVVYPSERTGWPAVSVVDRREADPHTGLLSEELVHLADRLLPAVAPLVCVLNRTGRARLLACAACGALARCERCGRPTGRDGDEVLRCQGCGTERPVVCASCGATRLKVLRQGVSQVREELAALLGLPVGEVAGPREAVPEAPVLVGTEAVLHRVRRAAAVVFLDFDQHLLAPRFTAAEEALALLARAGRLVGGRGQPGSGPVLVQTRLPSHEVLVAGVHGDPSLLADYELALRRELGLPPASVLALVSGPVADEYCRTLEMAGVGVSDLGDGRWLVRAPDHRVLCDALAAAPRPAGRLRVEVDPTDV